MMQASEERLGDDAADGLDAARNRRILAQRQVGASLVVVSLIQSEQVAKVPLAEHHDIIQAFPSDRADQPFSIAILPWRTRRGRPVTNAHRPKATDEHIAVDGIAVAHQVLRCCFPTTGLGELARDPFRRGVRGYAQPQDLAATVVQYQRISNP